MAKRGKDSQQRATVLSVVESVFIRSIDKGQLPTIMLGVVAIIIVARMPPDSLGTTAKSVADTIAEWHLLNWAGYVLWLVTASILGGYIWIKQSEINRLVGERNRLQGEKAKRPLPSSKDET
jgi:hypothetical protein